MGSWLNVRETAAHLGVSTATVYNWERAGLLPQRPQEGPVRFPAPAVRMLAVITEKYSLLEESFLDHMVEEIYSKIYSDIVEE